MEIKSQLQVVEAANLKSASLKAEDGWRWLGNFAEAGNTGKDVLLKQAELRAKGGTVPPESPFFKAKEVKISDAVKADGTSAVIDHLKAIFIR